MRITPVIMSGGSGSRLWPLSTEAAPKQFHAIGSDLSLLQQTAKRVAPAPGSPFLPPLIVANRAHRETVERQMAEAGLATAGLVLEPFGRNTAAVAVIAAAICEAPGPDGLVLLLAADHVVRDAAGFREAVVRGAAVAHERIVTFGIQPTAPETGYGYIQRGAALADGVFEAARFTEKPSVPVARDYLASGAYFWNAGYFLFSPRIMLQEMRAARPDIVDGALASLAASTKMAASSKGAVIELDPATFAACPAESVDLAVMERTRLAAVAPCDIGWADVGSWSELWRLSGPDANGNVLHGPAHAIDTQGALVWSDGVAVTTLGVENLIVVATREGVIVLPKSRAQEVKRIVEHHRARAVAADGGQ